MRAKEVTVMRWYAQDEVNQDYSEQNEVDGMKKGGDSTERLVIQFVWTYYYKQDLWHQQTDNTDKLF